MPSLLRIDASSRLSGSHSRALADAFEAAWSARFPGGEIARLFGFLGVSDVTVIPVESTTVDAATIASNIGRAKTDILNLIQAA